MPNLRRSNLPIRFVAVADRINRETVIGFLRWLACVCFMLWTRRFLAIFAVIGGVSLLASAIIERQARTVDGGKAGTAVFAVHALLVAAVATAAFSHVRFDRIRDDWAVLSTQFADNVKSTVATRLELVRIGAMEDATRAAAAASHAATPAERFDAVDLPYDAKHSDAIAMFSDSGQLIAWAGNHMGVLPREIRLRSVPLFFSETPLFRYMYVSVPVPNSTSHVVAAVLMETSLIQNPSGLGVGARLRDETISDVSMHAPNEATTQRIVYTLSSGREAVMNVYYTAPRQSEIRRRAERLPRQIIIIVTLLAYAMFWFDWIRKHSSGQRTTRGWPLLALAPIMALAPFGKAFAVDNSIPPMFGLIPWIDGDPLAIVMASILPICAFLLTWKVSPFRMRGDRARLLLTSFAAGCLYFVAVRWAYMGVTPAFVGQEDELWIPFQLLVILCLSSLTVVLFQRGKTHEREQISRPMVLAGTACAIALAIIVSTTFDPGSSGVSLILPWLSVIPFALFARGLPSFTSRSTAFLHAVCAVSLAASAVLPWLWRADLSTHTRAAADEISRLGSPPDPHLDYLLDRFASASVERAAAGDGGVHLLYRTWLESGLAKEPYAAQLSLWTGKQVVAGQIGPSPELDARESGLVMDAIDSARRSGRTASIRVDGEPHLSRVLAVPLADSKVISVVIPPRRTITPAYGAEFFPGHVTESRNHLVLTSALPIGTADSAISWRMESGGPVGDTVIKFADGNYHAHVQVPTASVPLRLARGLLLLTLDAAVLTALWIVGVIGRGRMPIVVESWRMWPRSIQSRVTLALFLFFLIPTIVFGLLAYRALAGEEQNTTQIVTKESAARAAVDFNARAANLQEIASESGSDLLRYLGGELIDASTPGALELGAYAAWVPADIYQQFERGQENSAVHTLQMGGSRLVTAFHTTAPSGILAVPLPLYSSDDVGRTTAFAHLALFSVLFGAMLSFALSMIVGRTLTKSIDRLTRAAADVGRGRLSTMLPANEPGEFGELFRSFNSMVRELRRARSRQVQSARVLAWGEMAQQVAHEVKNPLTPMKLSVQHVQRAFHDQHPQFDRVLNDSVDDVLREIEHLDRIARAFSRYGAPESSTDGPVQLVALAPLVDETLSLYRSGHDGTDYQQRIAEDLPPVRARPGEFKEVLLNLLENARDARRTSDDKGSVTVEAFQSSGGVFVEVKDRGDGIPPDIIERVFDPHFSTRPSGTGLGLAIVRRLVESWGGSVEIHSEVGRGTSVVIRLETS